jgi:hypothetical protein
MTATDPFVNFQPGLQTPVRHSFAITPNDTTELPFVTRAIYAVSSGDITARLADDTASVTFKAVAVGAMLPVRVRQVYATGTTAGMVLVGLY